MNKSTISCLVSECENAAGTKGLCITHHIEAKKIGVRYYLRSLKPRKSLVIEWKNPINTKGQFQSRPLMERIWERVDKTTPFGKDGDCWEWKGSKIRGYGQIADNDGRNKRAHRVIYEDYFQVQLTPDQFCCHRCDNPSCVNPLHMFIGTTQDNTRDRDEKGRAAKGEKHWTANAPEKLARGERQGSAKMTADGVRDMRNRFDKGEATATALAKEYDMSIATTCKIIKRQLWKHVD